MLRCSGGRIYTGYAVDVQARYQQHCTGKGARFTKAFPPECILKTFELESKELALRLEARIKKLDKPQKERLTAGDEVLEQSLFSGLSEVLKPKKKRKKIISAKSNPRSGRSQGRCCRR
ncbi:GIY-YIG nuclease family protein [Fibrobacter sp. UWEL]|uniref:GIY-YIG nuclease family protein n=1 Tax=Fibrobacter sp. UWEL TaxID=1896209 RepID=UPI000923966F|nr:GIY-YIG nuclease family protein [Fibrobacter sp. UWEL]SHK84974.1 putative endonuclease [Fibrobacter sp. UWEL]